MTIQNRHRIAAVLALAIGLMSIVEGGSVLLGIETKTYPVLQWLLRYNVIFGFVSVAAGIGLWLQRPWGIMLARTVLVCHGLVLLALIALFMFGKTVATFSIMAMLFRTGVWSVINFMIRGKGQKGQGQV